MPIDQHRSAGSLADLGDQLTHDLVGGPQRFVRIEGIVPRELDREDVPLRGQRGGERPVGDRGATAVGHTDDGESRPPGRSRSAQLLQ